MKTPDMEFRVLTEEQFQELLTNRQDAIAREKRMIELTEQVHRENLALKAGLIHYNKTEVASMLHCSTKQVERYEASGELKATRIGGKVLYSAQNLIAFIEKFNVQGIEIPNQSSFPKRKRR